VKFDDLKLYGYVKSADDLYWYSYKMLTERFQYYLQDLERVVGQKLNGMVVCDHRGPKDDEVVDNRGDQLGLREDEVKFYDALANNESAVRELQDETLKKIAQELTQSLRENLTVDWSERESVRAKLRLMVKRILKKYKYPPDQAEAAVELVLEQAQSLGEGWAV
jgi:chromosome condensin MukBEF complex kleisin-like MukF subunit